MKTFAKISSFAGASFLTISGANALAVDGNFTPTKWEVTFYEIGLTNTSDTSRRFQIFSGEQTIDLASNNWNELSSGVTPSAGIWNAIYVITSNTIKVAGNNGSCYVKSGNQTSSTGGFTGVTTTNSASAGDANITWSSFLGSSSTNPNISTTINGSATSVIIYSTNSSAPVTPTIVAANRFLFIGTGGISVNTTGSPKGTVRMNFGLGNSMTFSGSCTQLSYNNMTYALAVDEY